MATLQPGRVALRRVALGRRRVQSTVRRDQGHHAAGEDDRGTDQPHRTTDMSDERRTDRGPDPHGQHRRETGEPVLPGATLNLQDPQPPTLKKSMKARSAGRICRRLG